MDEEGYGVKYQNFLESGARRDISTAGCAAYIVTTVAQGVGLKKSDTRIRQQRKTKRMVPRTHLVDDHIAIVKLITKS